MTYNRYLKRFLSLQVIIHEIDVNVGHLSYKITGYCVPEFMPIVPITNLQKKLCKFE